MKKIWGKIISFFEKHLTIIKLLFVFSVLTFVLREITKIAHDVSGQQVADAFASQTPIKLITMFVLGFVAVLPMLNYDAVVVKLLGEKYSPSYIFRSGWIVNTFTNIAGFGGVLGASLRVNFYGKKDAKKIVAAISKVALFLVSGLSMLSIISLVLIYFLGIGTEFQNYWIWLFGGALYFVAVWLFTRVNNSSFFDDLTWKIEGRLILGSTFEWLGCVALFILIGFLMNLPIHNFLSIVPLFVVASIVGEVSLVPGGLGTFDVFMILGLSQLGVNQGDAVVWILFYRLFYYIFPFMLGVGFFAHDLGHRINVVMNRLPSQALHRFAQIFTTGFLYFAGIMSLLLSTVPNAVWENRVFVKLYPYTFIFVHQQTNIIVAFMLIGFASGIAVRNKRAYWPTVILLGVAIVNTLVQFFSIKLAVFMLVVLFFLVMTRKDLDRERMTLSWGIISLNSAIFIATFVLYAVIGYINQPHHLRKIPDPLLFPSERLWFAGFIGLLVAALVLYVIFRYLSGGNTKFSSLGFEPDRIQSLIERFGGNKTSHLVYLRDKQTYFYQVDGQDEVLFAYRKNANRLVIMGEPIGNFEKFEDAISQLRDDADREGYSLVFYEIGEKLTMLLHEIGFDFIKTGEEGRVELSSFTTVGTKRKGERATLNKMDREGFQFEIIQPPFSGQDFSELKAVSEEWLNGHVEKGFSLGFFDEYYLNQAPIAVIRDKENHIVAFANIMPEDGKRSTSIDLMRYSKEAPSGVMDALFIRLFENGREQGFKYFDMGMAPLSNVGISKYSFLYERAAHFIYEYGYRFYGFQGLRSYKEKYVTKWDSMYIAYQRQSSLVFTMLQILQIVGKKNAIVAS
ncbi:bifunctional lysylphosphatidylglycerol flippase/synthetase MprF [Pediococcus claussenii]|uniref:Phosphatidylglycerol lysyltransferase n=1 Tax=Pediococcus claussenii (strain ATCC BAA-344 / DSM 14800 / JCM 18046 / KCTC 3811 / LMG 21948 / P06) TaxID=701521 RepID=G8PBN8_PEDCP|nr:bifunctional lysylphosphatidylglycerol flippase/synthetase MprF [Pediococcus claussenii]AEV94787.1 hypothetical protein PECL_485 [Pediococcus claussenii ATCC BAA-344]ANZ71799.1 hypothetical protein AYR58_06500 [Pediococcus claussenii]